MIAEFLCKKFPSFARHPSHTFYKVVLNFLSLTSYEFNFKVGCFGGAKIAIFRCLLFNDRISRKFLKGHQSEDNFKIGYGQIKESHK